MGNFGHKERLVKYAIKIEEFGVVVDLYSENCVGVSHSIPIKYVEGEITSTMYKEKMPSREDYSSFSRSYNDESTSRAFHDAIINAIEAMILAHAIAGIDISEEKYIEGIRAAIEAAEKEYK